MTLRCHTHCLPVSVWNATFLGGVLRLLRNLAGRARLQANPCCPNPIHIRLWLGATHLLNALHRCTCYGWIAQTMLRRAIGYVHERDGAHSRTLQTMLQMPHRKEERGRTSHASRGIFLFRPPQYYVVTCATPIFSSSTTSFSGENESCSHTELCRFLTPDHYLEKNV